ELRTVVPAYSRLALAAICVIVVSGAFQAWRQLGSLSNLRDTDYGKLLAAKLIAFGALIITAAFSREIVNRPFRPPPPPRAGARAPDPPLPVPPGAPPLPPDDGGDGGRGGDGSGGTDGSSAGGEAARAAGEMPTLRAHLVPRA